MTEAAQPQVKVPGDIKISERVEAVGFPVMWTDWDLVKQHVGACRVRLDLWEIVAALGSGAAFTLLSVAATQKWPPVYVVALTFCFVITAIAILARWQMGNLQRQNIQAVIEEMEHFEKRYKRPKGGTEPQ